MSPTHPSPAEGKARLVGDHAARDRARFELGRNILVEAGAGTGKTTLLTDRRLFTLLAGGPEGKGLDLSRIVALTFTEKAAGEVQLRLGGRLADIAAELSGVLPAGRRQDDARRLLEEARTRLRLTPEKVGAAASTALERMDRAMIGTIHHFASHVLRLYPLESGVDPGFEVDTGPGLEDLFESEWALWLDQELGEAAPRRDAWLSMLPLVGLADLEILARGLCLEETRQCAPGSTAAMRARMKKLAACLRGFSAKPPPKGNSKIVARATAIAARLEDLGEACLGRGRWPDRPELSKPEESSWPKAWEGDRDEASYREALALAKGASGDGERLVRRAVELLRPFADRFCERYRRRGLVSYFGLLRRARDLVRDQGGVREALKARYGALFIDEFQDTDPIQGELILYLAERRGDSASTWKELRLEPGKLFVVGDPKQSIYRFRGADIRAYQEFSELVLRQGALKCDLQTSFRSHAGIVEPVNAAHQRLMRQADGLQPSYLPIQAYRAEPEGEGIAAGKPGPGVELVVARSPDGERLSADDARAREAAWIASWIAEHCGPSKPYAYRHVAILMRTTTALGPYLEALKRVGLPYAVEADRYFYGTQEALDLLNLLRVLDDPGDRLSLAGLLRSPLAALDDKELYELSRAGRLDYRLDPPARLAASTRARITGLWKALRGARERAGREPLGDFVARVLGDTFLVELASAAYYGEQTASNLLKFARLASDAGDQRGATLKEFIGLVERSMREGAKEGESPLADEHLDAVRILSIHKAKGLEWPVVLIPNLAALPGGGGDSPAWRVDWSSGSLGLSLPKVKATDAAMAFLKLEEERRESHEAVRLLYVAMTRARDRLILLGGQRLSGEDSFAGLLAQLGAWPVSGAPAEVLWGECRVTAGYLDQEPAAVPIVRGAKDTIATTDLAGLGKLWKARRTHAKAAGAPRVTSATLLASAREKPSIHADSTLSEEGPALEADARLVGVLCHRVLEQWDYDSPGDLPAAIDAQRRRLEREGRSPGLGAVAAESRALLSAFLDSPAAGELARAEFLGRELPFVYAQDGVVVRGTIDVLYRSGGKLWVADYKTERVAAREAAVLAKSHATQASIYREAVRRSLGEDCGFRLIFLRTGQTVEVPGKR